MACKWFRFAYRVLPIPGWRAFLLDRHIDGCPSCQSAAFDGQEIRSLGVTPADLQGEPPLSLFTAALSAPARRRTFRLRWSYVFGLCLATVALGAVIAVLRLVPREHEATGRVYVGEAVNSTCVFAVLEAKVDGEPARPVIFKSGVPGMTIVWFEKIKN